MQQGKLSAGHATPYKVTFSPQQVTPGGMVATHTSVTPQRTNYIPIAPSPLSAQAVTPSAKEVLAGLTSMKTSNGYV